MSHYILCLLLIMNVLFVFYKFGSLHRLFMVVQCGVNEKSKKPDLECHNEKANTQDFYVSVLEIILVVWLGIVNWNTVWYWAFLGSNIIISMKMNLLVKNKDRDLVYKGKVWRFFSMKINLLSKNKKDNPVYKRKAWKLFYVVNELICSVYYIYAMYSIGLLSKFVK